MAYKDILPAIYSVLNSYVGNYTWEGVKMDMEDETMTINGTDKALFYARIDEDEGGAVIDGAFGYYKNTLNVTLQTITYMSKLNIVTGDKDYERQVARGLMQEDVLTALGSCFNALGDAGVREIEYVGDSAPTEDTVKKDAVRRDYIFKMEYEQTRGITNG